MTDRLADLLGHALDEATGGDDWQPSVELLDRAWTHLVAPEAADFTRVDRVDWSEQRLVVAVDSRARLEELDRHRRRFEARLADRLPAELESISFEVGDVERTTDDGQADAADEPSAASPVSADAVSPEQRDVLEDLDAESRSAALRILGHVRGDD